MMKYPKTKKEILQKINNPFLNLYYVTESYYWYFEYHDTANNILKTHSVLTTNLADMSLDSWVEEAYHFLNAIKEENHGCEAG